MLNGLILESWFLNFKLFFQQENLIYVADPESFEVTTKDMDSTLSRASRAIKKTSKKVSLGEILDIFLKCVFYIKLN